MKKLYLLLFIATLSISAFAAEAAEKAPSAETPAAETATEAGELLEELLDPQESVLQIYGKVTEYLTEHGLQLLLNVLAAAAVFFIGRWLAGLVAKLLHKAMAKAKVDPTLNNFVKNLLYSILLVFVVIAALARLGVQTNSFIALVGAAGLAVGLALQGSLSNFAAGVLMIIFKPFKLGDFVEIGGASGTVKEIEIFTTTLDTLDNRRVIIPNAQVTGTNIINYTVNGTRRVDLVIGVSYGDDIGKAKEIMMGVLKSHELVLQTPEPAVAVLELADSSVNYVVRPWCKSSDYWTVRFDVTERVKLALEANGLSIPFPQRDVHMINAPTS